MASIHQCQLITFLWFILTTAAAYGQDWEKIQLTHLITGKRIHQTVEGGYIALGTSINYWPTGAMFSVGIP